VRAWLKKHPRFKMHFTPTSSSWLNLVERFFADLTGDVIRAGSSEAEQAEFKAIIASTRHGLISSSRVASGEAPPESL
jgi:hypothetical protein